MTRAINQVDIPAPTRWQRAHQWLKAMAEANPGIMFQAIIGDYVITAECDREEDTMAFLYRELGKQMKKLRSNGASDFKGLTDAAEEALASVQHATHYRDTPLVWSNGPSAGSNGVEAALETPPEPDSIKGLYLD